MAGIFEKHILEYIARIGTTDNRVDILITIVVEIAKSNTVPFLQMTKTTRTSHILE